MHEVSDDGQVGTLQPGKFRFNPTLVLLHHNTIPEPPPYHHLVAVPLLPGYHGDNWGWQGVVEAVHVVTQHRVLGRHEVYQTVIFVHLKFFKCFT